MAIKIEQAEGRAPQEELEFFIKGKMPRHNTTVYPAPVVTTTRACRNISQQNVFPFPVKRESVVGKEQAQEVL